MISALNHPHICTLFDVGHEGDSHFLVMELLEGESLVDRLQRGPLPLDQVVKFGAQVADALDSAHKQGIVHRDLKPGNVVLTQAGAKLLDFGLARSARPRRGLSRPRRDAADGGEAPHRRRHAWSARTSTWPPSSSRARRPTRGPTSSRSGRVLYEMATGTASVRRQVEDEPGRGDPLGAAAAPSRRLQPMMPPALDHVVRKCLEKEPDDRWQSAHDVASELRWIGEAARRRECPATAVPRDAAAASGSRGRWPPLWPRSAPSASSGRCTSGAWRARPTVSSARSCPAPGHWGRLGRAGCPGPLV